MRNISSFIASCLLVVGLCVFTATVRSQEKDVVIAQGDPPLTQLMAGKVIVLLDWALELKMSTEQELQIKQILVDTWRSGDRAQIRGALDLIDVYEKVFRMSVPEQNASRGRLRDLILERVRAERRDRLARLLLSMYEASHPAGGASTPRSTASTPVRSKSRVGGDGFTGVHRMIRPRPLNINNSGYEPGYRVEYITFLPDGHVYWTLPPEGLLYFDPAVAQRAHPDDWGTYTIKNGEIHILRGPERRPYVITRTGERLNNPPSLGKGTFRHIPPADGLRIDGNYRRSESEPTITFTSDGRFRDEGIFRNFGTAQWPDGTIYQDDGRGGSGTYTIEQYTLELRYSDGRVRRAPFIVFPENLAKKPAVDSFILRWEESMRRY